MSVYDGFTTRSGIPERIVNADEAERFCAVMEAIDAKIEDKPFIRRGQISLWERAKLELWLRTGWPRMNLETGEWE